jgi:hypothetical protein
MSLFQPSGVAEYVRSEHLARFGVGMAVLYRLEVEWEPKPTILADVHGIYLAGQHIAAGRAQLNRIMACMEAAWSDHLALKLAAEAAARRAAAANADAVPATAESNVLSLAHGKSPREQGGSSV